MRLKRRRESATKRGKKSAALTRGKAPKSVRHRIIAFLDASSPLEVQPKIIASRIHSRPATVRKEICRMLAEPMPPIVQVREGWYRSSFDIDKLRALKTQKRIGLHGIKIEGICRAESIGYSLLQTSSHQYRKRGIFGEVFNGRSVTITVHQKGMIEVWVNASKAPLGFEEFDRFCFWLHGKFSGIVLEHEWKISQIGINCDIEQMHIDGFKSMTLKAWRNAWAQIYQKQKDVVRLEVHMVPDMRLQDALNVIGSFKEMIETQGEVPYSPPPTDRTDISYG